MNDVRNQPQVLSKEQQMLVAELEAFEVDFRNLCVKLGDSRELSLAITNLEQASMWALRHVLGSK